MAYRDQIVELHRQGKSIRKIAEALDLSRNTVRRYLRSESAPTTKSASLTGWAATLDWEELQRRHAAGVQVNQLFADYGPPGVSLPAFYRRFSLLRQQSPAVTIRMTHKPAERTEVDYADGIDVFDPQTGRVRKTQFFCGVLPFSSYCFGEFTWDQKKASFLKSHENMWRYFQGVTPYVTPDNLKSGVTKAHRYDPETNATYCDFANHYGFAALPARPRKPRDKATVEATIGAIQRSFYQQVAETKFYSLGQLNLAFQDFLKSFNHRVMKEYGVSRWERFQQEHDKLLPLPAEPYDLREWKIAKVHPDCHVQVQHCFYSVPFQLVGQEVRVRMSATMIEIFDKDCQPVAAHQRIDGRGRRVTIDAHLPEEKLQACRFEIRQAMARADALGPKFSELMDKLFEGPRPLIHLRRAQGMLRMLGRDGIGAEALEYAAGQCLTFRKYRLSFFRNCALAYSRQRLNSRKAAPLRDLATLCLHYGGEQ